MSDPKELHFFDRRYDRGIDWYMAQFDSDANVCGEATPAYMSDQLAVVRMAERLPKAKIVLSLREPVDRAISHYWMRHERGTESRSLPEAFNAEIDTLEADGPDSQDLLYVGNSLYFHHLRRWLSRYPFQQVHVMVFERTVANPHEEYRRLCRFLGVADQFVPSNLGRQVNQYVEFRSLAVRDWTKTTRRRSVARIVSRINTRVTVRYPRPKESIEADLKRVLRQSNTDLEQLLGERISEWD